MGKFKISFLFICVLFSVKMSLSQDLEITSANSPADGCDLTSSETVGVAIRNNSNSLPAFGGDYTLSYTINDTGLVSENPGAPINPNSTINHNFMSNADLSPCGSYVVQVWVDHPGDGNSNNDTLQWTVQNNCSVIPGEVLNDKLVCETTNQDTLFLDNRTHGTIDDWIFSTDKGSSWTELGITDTFYVFNDLTDDTEFQVIIDGGLCPNDTSDIATVSIQATPDGGTVDGAVSTCDTSATGVLEVVGASSSVIEWESSVDEGATWTTIANNLTTEAYDDLTETTWYRAILNGGVCADVYSDTAIIAINPLPDASFTGLDTAYCLGASSVTLTPNQSGGTFSGPGITGKDFDPSAAGLGEHAIAYEITDENGCTQDTNQMTVINALPDSTFTGLDAAYCHNEAPVTLVPNEPGGIFKGAGVASGNIFYPGIAPTGAQLVTYAVTNNAGCTASSTQTVAVSDAPNSTFISDGLMLEAQAVGQNITYQWYSCATGDVIPEATDQTYEVTQNGSYALITGKGECSDTSDCILVYFTDLDEKRKSLIEMYPNPNNGEFIIELPASAEVSIYNPLGQEVYSQQHRKGTSVVHLKTTIRTGIYLVKVADKKGNYSVQNLVIK